MRRAGQRWALSIFLVTGIAATDVLAQEPVSDAPAPASDAPASHPQDEPHANTEADTHENTEEPKQAEQPAAAASAEPAPTTEASPVVEAPAPKVGDISVSGYLRGAFGATLKERVGDPDWRSSGGTRNVGGRMTCFNLPNPSGLVSKYRLGNECEVWSETHFSVVAYANDGVVATVHVMPTVYIPTTYIGYSPTGVTSSPAEYTTSTGATLSFPNLYVDIKGIPWLGGGTAWMGTRYYKRESVYISDFFYWNPSGVGAGIEDVHLGKDLRLSYAAFAVDGEPVSTGQSGPPLPLQADFGIRNDVQLRGIRPYASGEFQAGFQYIADDSNHKDANGKSVTHGGWGVTVQHVQQLLGGDNKLAFQYGRGGGTGFGTLSRFYYPDFSLYFAPSEYRLRVVEVLTVQPLPWLGAQGAFVYQHDDLGNAGQKTDWISTGLRAAWGFTRYAKLLGEVGYDYVKKSNGSDPQLLTKFTLAPAISTGPKMMSRPELRLFYTYAFWNEAARTATVDSGRLYTATDLLSGTTVGVQAETWW
jgi:maltoporin